MGGHGRVVCELGLPGSWTVVGGARSSSFEMATLPATGMVLEHQSLCSSLEGFHDVVGCAVELMLAPQVASDA